MVSVCFLNLLAGIWRWVVGAGSAVLSAIEAAEHFLLRSDCDDGFEMIFSEVSICHTLTPPRTILCSPFFRFFLGLVVLLFALCLFCVELVVSDVSEVVEVAIHGVDWSPSSEDQMMYAILLHICQRYSTSWEYKSARSQLLWLRRANNPRVKIP